jgi:uncharacterized iron-regulated membrane protein
MQTDTLKRFLAVHTWTGLATGIALFIAFYAGALTMLYGPLVAWERWQGKPADAMNDSDVDRFLDRVFNEHPSARDELFVYLPDATGDVPLALGMRGDDGARPVWMPAADGSLIEIDIHDFGEVADTLNHVHFTLGLPESIGLWFLGLVSLVYGLALVSGVVIHLPKLAEDLFALRWGPNLKRLWQDAHNVVGVLSLPFHVIFAITGVLLCSLVVIVVGLNFGGMEGRAIPLFQQATALVAPQEPSRQPVPRPPLAELRRLALADQPSLQPHYLRLVHAGDAHGSIELRGPIPGHLAAESRIAFDARGQHIVARAVPGDRHPADLATRVVAALHFGTFGGALVQGLYLLLGLAGAFLFYSGNLLWLESRRKRRQALQPRHHRALARLTVGTCLGCVLGCAAVLIASQANAFIPALPTGMSAYLLVFVASVLFALALAPSRAAIALLGASALAYPAAALLRWANDGWTGTAAIWTVDGVLLALGASAALLARATARRGEYGDARSVWSLRAADSAS